LNLSVDFLNRQPLDESLVLGFEYDYVGKQIELVYDYAAEVVSKHFQTKSGQTESKLPLRDFRRIIFDSVDGFQIRHQEVKGDELLALLKEKIASPGVIVIKARFVNESEYTATKLDLSFGFHVAWNFQNTSTERKLCYSKQVSENEWKYFENTTSKEIDFYKPFD